MNVGYVANSLASTESVNLLAVLSAFGHSVSTSTQAAFASGTFSAQDAVVVGPTDRDDAAFAADLDVHMDTHGVPVLLTASGGLASAGAVARNGSGVADSTAALLGMLTLERRNQDSPTSAPDSLELRDDARGNFAVASSFGTTDYGDDEFMLARGSAGMWVSHVAEALDGTTLLPREVAAHACGARLANDGRGFTMALAGEAGDARVGARFGEVLSTRCAWLGASGSIEFGRDGAALLEALLAWLVAPTASPAVDQYPVGSGNGAVLARVDLRPLGTFDSGTIAWTASTPAGTSLSVDVSDDEGASWSAQSNGGAVAVLSMGEDVSTKRLLVRVSLSTSDPDETPALSGLLVTLKGEDPSLQSLGTDGSKLGTLAGDSDFVAGHVVWVTGENAGLSMEVRSWTSATRTLQLWLPMRLDVAPGDVFDIYPGCLKRFAEDCVGRYGHTGVGAPKFRGEPHVPGQDFVTQYPDAQG